MHTGPQVHVRMTRKLRRKGGQGVHLDAGRHVELRLRGRQLIALFVENDAVHDDQGDQDHSVLGGVAEGSADHDVIDQRQNDERQAGNLLIDRAFAPENQDHRNDRGHDEADILDNRKIGALIESLCINGESQRIENIDQENQGLPCHQDRNPFIRPQRELPFKAEGAPHILVEIVDHQQVEQLAEHREDERKHGLTGNPHREVKQKIDSEPGADKNIQEPERVRPFPFLLHAAIEQACGNQRSDRIHAAVEKIGLHPRINIRIDVGHPGQGNRKQRDCHCKTESEQRRVFLQFFNHGDPGPPDASFFCQSGTIMAHASVQRAHT